MLYELIEDGFGNEENYNCSEKILYAANLAYNLNLDKKALVMSAGFGGGMAVGSTCGALTGAVMAISSRLVEDKARESNVRNVVELYLRNYESKMKSINCLDLKSMYYNEDKKCKDIVLEAAKLLDQVFYSLDRNEL